MGLGDMQKPRQPDTVEAESRSHRDGDAIVLQQKNSIGDTVPSHNKPRARRKAHDTKMRPAFSKEDSEDQQVKIALMSPTRQTLIPLESIESDREILRKRCLASFFVLVYVLLALVAVVATYSMILGLVIARKNPVRSIRYKNVTEYDPPVRLSDMDLKNKNCSYEELSYEDPHYPGTQRDALVVKGPVSFTKREAVFLHFALEDDTRDFFTVSYFVFPRYISFNTSSRPSQLEQLIKYHRYMPTFALSAGLRMWIKLIMSEKSERVPDARRTDFRVEYSVVLYNDNRTADQRKRHLFFIFFEWKNNIIEQSNLVYTTTPWNMGAGLCGVFLMLHRGYQLARASFKHFQKDKRRRTLRKQTLRELRSQQSVEQGDSVAC